jgi:hypothetical protein
MKRFKYYICARDLICIAHGEMDKVRFYTKKPKQCDDSYCDNEILEMYLSIDEPIKYEATKQNKDKNKSSLRNRIPRRNKK